jgi:hypothetical protein
MVGAVVARKRELGPEHAIFVTDKARPARAQALVRAFGVANHRSEGLSHARSPMSANDRRAHITNTTSAPPPKAPFPVPMIATQQQNPAMSRSYLLAVEDTAFLLRDEMRAIRFALEYAKAELALRDWGIRSTIIVFGGARVPSPEQAAAAARTARGAVERQTAERLQVQSKYYEVAREFGRVASQMGGAVGSGRGRHDNVIATGGGLGIMEAANRGAFEAGAPSIGFNIALPQEQQPNAYITAELSFQFHYFAMRKMHLAMRAAALAIFPGGFGTLDELFELLTLQQTRKAPPAPIVLFGKAYWRKLVDFEMLAEEGMISPADLQLFEFAESAEEGWASLARRGLRTHSSLVEAESTD